MKNNWIDIGIKKPFHKRYYDFLCIKYSRIGNPTKTIIKEKTYDQFNDTYVVLKSGQLVREIYKIIAFRKA